MSEPVKANRKTDYDALESPGDFIWSHRSDAPNLPSRMLFLCPCGCGAHAGIAVRPESGGGPVWQWDGDFENPTITPSIRRIGGCEWHGYLTGGYFREC